MKTRSNPKREFTSRERADLFRLLKRFVEKEFTRSQRKQYPIVAVMLDEEDINGCGFAYRRVGMPPLTGPLEK